jgi:hypothetical protein
MAGLALTNLISDPNDQPVRDILMFAVMITTFVAIIFRKRWLLFPFAGMSLVNFATAIASGGNATSVIGSVVGGLVLLVTAILGFRSFSLSKTENSVIKKTAA